ncbi:hypothetical protein D3C80_1197790 [compost metagenome]
MQVSKDEYRSLFHLQLLFLEQPYKAHWQHVVILVRLHAALTFLDGFQPTVHVATHLYLIIHQDQPSDHAAR